MLISPDKKEVTSSLEDLVKDMHFKEWEIKPMNIQEFATSVYYLGIQGGMPGHYLQSKRQTIPSHNAYHEDGSTMAHRLLWLLEALRTLHWPTHQVISKASGPGPGAGPGSGSSSLTAWSLGHVRPCVLEMIVVGKDAQEILASTMYYPAVLEQDHEICSNVLIFFLKNRAWLIPSYFGPLELTDQQSRKSVSNMTVAMTLPLGENKDQFLPWRWGEIWLSPYWFRVVSWYQCW